MRHHSINELNNFIGGWYFKDTSICVDLIDYFNSSSNKYTGHTYKSGKECVDVSTKNSIDCLVDDQSLLTRYYSNLSSVIDSYIEKYPWCNNFAPWTTSQNPQIQYYSPGNAFNSWHSERTSGQLPAASRHLVYMTYLNDVDDGGETEFFHQKLKIKPEVGLTLIWGCDWTFLHKGLPAKQEKYIVTGWFNFTN